jgi:predicted GIY-YIG superfamily endonuclease
MKHFLYRHFNSEGVLLYVGITNTWPKRLSAHRRNAHWFDTVKYVTIEQLKDRDELELAEAIAIRDEKPQCNVQRPHAPAPPLDPLTILRRGLLAKLSLFRELCGEQDEFSVWSISHYFDVSEQVIRELLRAHKIRARVGRRDGVAYVATAELERVVLDEPNSAPRPYKPPVRSADTLQEQTI